MPFDMTALLQGRNPYGSVGGDVANALAQARASGNRSVNPFAMRAGYGLRDNGMDENPTVDFINYTNPDKWNSAGLIQRPKDNGGVTSYAQIGAFANDPQKLAQFVKDPSLIEYDEEGGLITPIDNMIEQPDMITDVMSGIIGAAALGGTAAGIGSSFFGTPDLTSLLGGGSSSTAGTGFGDPLQFLQPSAPGSFGTLAADPLVGVGAGASGAGTTAAGAAGAGSVIPGTTTPTVAGLGNSAIANVAAGTGGTTAAAAGNPLSFLSGLTGGSSPLSSIAQGLGLLNNLFGSGPGTARGATNAGNAAAAAADPFAGMRPEFQDELRRQFQSLISFDPSQIENDPAYQFQLKSGVEARNRAAAAQGMYRSGNREMELTRFGQDLASDFTNKQFARNQAILQQLAGLAGATSGSPSGAAQALLSGFQGASTLQNNAMNNVFSWLTGGGQSGPAPIDRIWNWLTS